MNKGYFGKTRKKTKQKDMHCFLSLHVTVVIRVTQILKTISGFILVVFNHFLYLDDVKF